MKYNRLGSSGLLVSDLCLGTMIFGEQSERATPAEEAEEAWEYRNTERNWRVIEAVGRIAEDRGASYSQIALAWLRAQPVVSNVIMGARTPAQLEDNLGAADIELTTEELIALAQASALPDLYPYRMIREYGARTPNPLVQ